MVRCSASGRADVSYVDDLTVAADFIATVQEDHISTQAMLRIAVHTSYQALLHCLQQMCADEFIGGEKDKDRPNKTWHEVYRALRHDVIRRSCQHSDLNYFPPEFRELAKSVYSLRQTRFSTDYDSRTVVNLMQV